MPETLLLPVPENTIITQTFAEHEARRIANGWRYYNGGIDWAVTVGTPIKAAAAGVVQKAEMDKTGYGLHVRILHKDSAYLSIYGHGSKLCVQPGDKVQAGDIVMLSGNTGNSTGPHLHYELRKNNNPIDPMPLFHKSVPTPEPEAVVDWTIDLAVCPRAQITVPTLNIRREPQVADHNYVGALLMGMTPEVLELKPVADGLWARIGQNQWIALTYQGATHAIPLPVKK